MICNYLKLIYRFRKYKKLRDDVKNDTNKTLEERKKLCKYKTTKTKINS